MAAADVFALLSRREGFGTVTAEAMACGLPCVVSPLDGIAREIVDEGRTGFVVDDPDDPDAVAARLRSLFSDLELRSTLGAAARETACARFSMEVRAERLAGIYRTLAGRAGR
jgi:glycosyltransferase involved in cell wall biosynthesis